MSKDGMSQSAAKRLAVRMQVLDAHHHDLVKRCDVCDDHADSASGGLAVSLCIQLFDENVIVDLILIAYAKAYQVMLSSVPNGEEFSS